MPTTTPPTKPAKPAKPAKAGRAAKKTTPQKTRQENVAQAEQARLAKQRADADWNAYVEKRKPLEARAKAGDTIKPEDVDVAALEAAMKARPDYVPDALEEAALKEAAGDSGEGDDKVATERAEEKPAEKPAAESPKGKTPKYSDEVKAAAKRVRDMLDGKGAPGPKQHVEVRKVVGDKDVEAVVGVPASQLKKFARTGNLDKDKRGNLGELAAKVGDPWARGRNLAAILVALLEDRGR